ncbi:hypothetical protein [Streptomyces azureus]|uniref:Puitative multidrug resistance protein mdtC n=1 Tax=Streptomyces azureus TaxID=146537 RepID=A0A0K8PK23_STRAJ|nr:hypothetical protein [Streptomyces azureus]GAP48237.1 puitative multidrug resistance protein mdtC [Streptomyces azureus]
MSLGTLHELLNLAQDHLPALPGPTGPVTAALMLARTAVRHLSLIWLTRGATPKERALILDASHGSPRPTWRDRCRRLVRRMTHRR